VPESELRRTLFENYRRGQAALSSGAVYNDVSAFWPLYDASYGDLVAGLSPSARILDAGCGHGSLIAWLHAHGLRFVVGVDLSPGDVAFAETHLGTGVVVLGEVEQHLRGCPKHYDAVFMKAMLEHVMKDQLLPLLRAVAGALTRDGVLVVEVPNMDWLLASHERYLDLTHEVGFTRESLAALLGLIFDQVDVRGSGLPAPTRSQRLLRRPFLALLRRLLYILGEGANDVLFAHRSLVAVASRPRQSA